MRQPKYIHIAPCQALDLLLRHLKCPYGLLTRTATIAVAIWIQSELLLGECDWTAGFWTSITGGWQSALSPRGRGGLHVEAQQVVGAGAPRQLATLHSTEMRYELVRLELREERVAEAIRIELLLLLPQLVLVDRLPSRSFQLLGSANDLVADLNVCVCLRSLHDLIDVVDYVGPLRALTTSSAPSQNSVSCCC
jgi:hypothetical protein